MSCYVAPGFLQPIGSIGEEVHCTQSSTSGLIASSNCMAVERRRPRRHPPIPLVEFKTANNN